MLSVPKDHDGHAGALEASALILGLRWALRKKCTLSTRIVFLVDAQAVLYAATKGRSSSPTLRMPMCRLAALSLLGNMVLKFVYVPSEYNAADSPSRGLCTTHRKARL